MKNGRFSMGEHSFRATVPPAREKFWNLFAQARWEPATFEVMNRHLTPESFAVDIGAWVGPTVLYTGCIAKRVVAFEPDPVAYAELCANLQLNPEIAERVDVRQAAMTATDGTLLLTAPDEPGKSETSALLPAGENSFEVQAVSAARLFTGELAEADYIKMDTEGGEYETLPAMKDFLRERKPVVYLSLHPENIALDKPESERGKLALEMTREALSCFEGWQVQRVTDREIIAAPEAEAMLAGRVPDKAPGGSLLFIPRR